MKTYKERLPEIDEAIFKLGGGWPPYVGDTSDFSRPFLIASTDNHSRGAGIYSCSNFGAEHDNFKWVRICTRTEFEARVADWRRLYEWRKEKGFVDIEFCEWLSYGRIGTGGCVESRKSAGYFNWQLSLEEKPELDDVYINTCGIKPCSDREDWERCGIELSDFKLSIKQTNSEILDVTVTKNIPKTDWFERGATPPIGEKVKYPTGKGVVVIDSTDAQGAIIIVDDFDGSYHRVFKSRVKPIRTERDELIDLAEHTIRKYVAANQYHKEAVKILAEAGMLKKPEEE